MFFLVTLVFSKGVFAADGDITISQSSRVPALCDETATYVFDSNVEGTIVYGGSCGIADKIEAVVGQNEITWSLMAGIYSDCTVTVSNGGVNSNTLAVPTFETTFKYPVVFVHGWGGNAAGWSDARNYLIARGWKSELLIANTVTESNSVLCGEESPHQAAEVAGWISATLDKYPGFARIDLVGHSRGGNNIMRGLWHGHINTSHVRRVVTMAGANRDCAPYYPQIPADETPGMIRYSAYYSDNVSDGEPDNDTWVNYDNTHIIGAHNENLDPLSHSELKSDTTALAAMRNSLLGIVGTNDTIIATFRSDVDGSSEITTTDALLTLRNSLGLLMSGTAWQGFATTGDVNCDGVSNSTDALLILRHSLGFPMGGTGWCE